jgi:hypothetical protein
MSDWAQVEAGAPTLAASVRGCFDVRKHGTMATLRADGSPRISGTEVQWDDGALWIHQPADGDPPDVGADLAAAVVAARAPPERDERVLEDLVHQVGVAAAALQASGQPRRVPAVELLQRAAVPGRDGA